MGTAAILAQLVQLGLVGLEAYQLVAAFNAGNITEEELEQRWAAMQSRLNAASQQIRS